MNIHIPTQVNKSKPNVLIPNATVHNSGSFVIIYPKIKYAMQKNYFMDFLDQPLPNVAFKVTLSWPMRSSILLKKSNYEEPSILFVGFQN